MPGVNSGSSLHALTTVIHNCDLKKKKSNPPLRIQFFLPSMTVRVHFGRPTCSEEEKIMKSKLEF